MRVLPIAVALAAAGTGCGDAPGPAARITFAPADTVVVNHVRPLRLPVRVLDAAGRHLPDSAVRFTRIAGAEVPLSESGAITCTRPGDAVVRATLGALATTAVVRCRPVHTLRVFGPVQMRVGDPDVDLPVAAFGEDGRAIDEIVGVVASEDTAVASVRGLRIHARAPGVSLLDVRVGNRAGRAGVHVYETVSSLDSLSPRQRMVAVPLRLARGDMRRWPLPPGNWMLTMLPEEDEAHGIRLRIEGANCLPSGLTKRRYMCLAFDGASVVVFHPSGEAAAPELTGMLLLRRPGLPQ